MPCPIFYFCNGNPLFIANLKADSSYSFGMTISALDAVFQLTALPSTKECRDIELALRNKRSGGIHRS